MTEDKIKESIQIAEELAKEICTGEATTSSLLEQWKKNSPALYEKLKKQELLAQEISFHDSIDVKEALKDTQKRITPSRRIISMRTISIAASFLIILGSASLWLWNGYKKENTQEWTTAMPGNSKTSMLSHDNKPVILEENNLAVKGNQLISSALDGKRNVAIELNPDNQFNRLAVPAGGEYQLTLEDGTVVQINAASELLFPTHFKKHMRQVHLKGEACFKVEKDQSSPFYVQLGAINVQVTGTSFNIKAHEEEEDIRITLIEGSVNIREGQKLLASLVPGQLFTYRKTAHDYNVSEANITAATSWTNGKFIFYNETIENIMRELSRWYDVDISVSDDIKNQRYSGILSRNQPLTEMLNAISLTQELDFTIHKNKKIDAKERKNQ